MAFASTDSCARHEVSASFGERDHAFACLFLTLLRELRVSERIIYPGLHDLRETWTAGATGVGVSDGQVKYRLPNSPVIWKEKVSMSFSFLPDELLEKDLLNLANRCQLVHAAKRVNRERAITSRGG